MKVRIKFRKFGVMKFIGHLDIMRFFQKAIRMSGIDICYSEGFSPHPLMSFAAPLGVGITSDGEYMDLEVHSFMSSEKAVQALNAVMPEGIEITGCVQLDDHVRTAMSVVCAADYEIWYKQEYEMPVQLLDYETLSQMLQKFFAEQEEVLVTKKTKKSEKVLDLKKLVYDFQILKPQEKYFNRPAFYMNVCTGSTDNVKPELVIEAFLQFFDLVYDPFAVQIHRIDIYQKDSSDKDACQSFLPLLKAGTPVR